MSQLSKNLFRLSLFFLPLLTFGAEGFGPTGSGGTTPDPVVPTTLPEVVGVLERITAWMYTIFLLVAVIMIIYAAFLYVTSGGGDQVNQANKVIIYSVIAIAVAFMAKGVSFLVENLLEAGVMASY